MKQLICGDVLVLGLGSSGRAAAEYLLDEAERGASVRVRVADASRSEDLEAAAARLRARGAEVRLGVSAVADAADLVIASPGIPPSSPLMAAAQALGAPVISEIEFAYRRSVSPWVAVTGTNGKTTTTALVSHLLREAGMPAEPVGNIGQPAITTAAVAGPSTVLVAEVSSFQLALTECFHPRVSVLLNVTPDHLDWHGSLETYAADKARIFANQTTGDVAVINVDDPGSAPYAERVAASGVGVCRVSVRSRPDGGAYLAEDVLTLAGPDGEVGLLPAEELRIRGSHNVSNALAAAAAASALGVDAETIAAGLRTFQPIEHRLEPVAAVGGVEFFNDSKATNPDSVIKALSAFDDQPVIVLLGGRNKGSDFRALARIVAGRCKAAVLFGEAGPEIAAAFDDATVVHGPVLTLRDALDAARSLANPGDVVVLSPGCASFDEFHDYEDRGRSFKRLVDEAVVAGG